jgi:serine protease Do
MTELNSRLLVPLFIGLIASACNAQQDEGALSDNLERDRPSARVSLNERLNDDITASRRNAITGAVQNASPAIVGINVTEIRNYADPFGGMFDDPFFERFFGRSGPRTYRREVKGLGSGFIVSADGYIITNDHVAGRASKVLVTTVGGREYEAKIIGSDPTSDVALLKIDGEKLPYLKLGQSGDVMVGEWVIALGNPFGLFDINSKPTVTVGVVSNTGVDLRPTDNRIYRGMIQTDAAISSGNSGGPLLNALGEVIGMNTVIYSTAQSAGGAGSIGIGFAVPVDRIKAIVADLRKDGSIDRDFWTGMQVQQLDENLARHLRLTSDTGVVVVEIAPGSPASEAGLVPGDVITSVNGEPVRTEDDAFILIADSRVGQKITLGIIRETKPRTVELTLTKRPRR